MRFSQPFFITYRSSRQIGERCTFTPGEKYPRSGKRGHPSNLGYFTTTRANSGGLVQSHDQVIGNGKSPA